MEFSVPLVGNCGAGVDGRSRFGGLARGTSYNAAHSAARSKAHDEFDGCAGRRWSDFTGWAAAALRRQNGNARKGHNKRGNAFNCAPGGIFCDVGDLVSRPESRAHNRGDRLERAARTVEGVATRRESAEAD